MQLELPVKPEEPDLQDLPDGLELQEVLAQLDQPVDLERTARLGLLEKLEQLGLKDQLETMVAREVLGLQVSVGTLVQQVRVVDPVLKEAPVRPV